MPRPLKLLLPALVVAAALLAIVRTSSDGSDGEPPQGKPVVDPDGQAAAVPRKPYVVMVIMDEFPGDDLRNVAGDIDAVRYPNFAALARNATWFPNAFTRYDSTPKAVPLILDGRKPFKGEASDRSDHFHTFYDTLGRRGYRIVDSEEATALCPRRYCRNARRSRPAILPNLGSDRGARFRRWVRTIKRGRATFWMKHVLMPHGPWLYLPSGARTRTNWASDPVPGMNSPRGFHDVFLTHHNFQRHLLQSQYADRLLGELLKQLVSQGMFDQTLLVLVADHGLSFEVGVKDRRKVTNGNVDEVGPVPMFFKAPGQRKGRVDGALASTLDVTPTIADLLNIRLGYRASGVSAFSRAVRRRSLVSLPTRDFSRIVRISARRWIARRRARIRRRIQLFGFGPTGFFDRIGPNAQLVGRPVSELRTLPAGKVRVRLIGGFRQRNVRRSTGIVPAHITGNVLHGRRHAKRNLAVAVNGRIEAVGRSWYLTGDRREHFAVMVPESSIREGRNSVQVYEVGGGALRLLGGV